MKMNTLVAILLAISLANASSQTLKCYDCGPDSEEKCGDPKASNVKTTICKDDPKALRSLEKKIYDIDNLDIKPKVTDETELEFECFALLYTSSENDIKSGVYRGCIQKTTDILSSCEYLAERLNTGNVTQCQTCQSDECNTYDIGGAASITISLVVVIVNLLIVLNVVTF